MPKDADAKAMPSKDKADTRGGGTNKGQRYYLYEKELSRPQPQFQPRAPGRSGRLPFSNHDYFGIYPTKGEADSRRYFTPAPPRIVSDSRYYTRPPDEYHRRGREDDRSRREIGQSSDRRSSHGHHSRDRYHHEDAYRVPRNPDDYERRNWDHRHGSSMDRDWRHGSMDRDGRHGSMDRDRRHGSMDRDRRRGSNDRDRRHGSMDRDRRHGSMDRYRRHGSSMEKDRRGDSSMDRSRGRTRSRSPQDKGNSDWKGRHRHRTPPAEVYSKETDLNVELHPLMHYVEDKPKLLQEAMSILRGKKLEALIPPELKRFSHSRLEYMCLKELKSISLATIANVIDGKIINIDRTVQAKGKKKVRVNSTKNKTTSKSKPGAGTAIPLKKIKKKLKKSIKETKETTITPKKKKKKKTEKGKLATPLKKSKTSKSKAKEKKVKVKDKKKKKKLKSAPAANTTLPDVPGLPPQKTLMELLELEYRAKAIKALLKTQGLDMNRIDDALSLDTSPPHQTATTATDIPSTSTSTKLPESGPLQTENSNPILPNISPVPIPVEVEASKVHTPNIPSASPDSTVVVNEPIQFQLTPVSKPPPESNTPTLVQVTSSLTPEQTNVDDDDECSSTEENEVNQPVKKPEIKAVPEEEELDYEGEVDMDMEEDEEEEEFTVIPPVPTPEEIPIEKEEGEICSDDEVSEPEDEEIKQPEPEKEKPDPFRNFRKNTEKGRFVDSSGSSGSDSDENNTGGWRVLDSDEESRNPKRRRRWVKDPSSPEPVYKRDNTDLSQLSDISNQDFPDPEPKKDKADCESPKPGSNIKDGYDSDGGFYPPPRSPTPTDADGNKIPESSDESSDDDNDADKDKITVITDEVQHTCAEKPEEYEEEEEEGREDDEDEEDTPITWFNRWYNSKKVQKNVKSNKLIGRLRSKLRREKPLPDLPPDPSKDGKVETEAERVPIVGSIQEYQKLFGSGKYKKLPSPEPEPVVVVEEPEVESEDEDEDEDELWGEIIGSGSTSKENR